jgi:hypothetical protein
MIIHLNLRPLLFFVNFFVIFVSSKQCFAQLSHVNVRFLDYSKSHAITLINSDSVAIDAKIYSVASSIIFAHRKGFYWGLDLRHTQFVNKSDREFLTQNTTLVISSYEKISIENLGIIFSRRHNLNNFSLEPKLRLGAQYMLPRTHKLNWSYFDSTLTPSGNYYRYLHKAPVVGTSLNLQLGLYYKLANHWALGIEGEVGLLHTFAVGNSSKETNVPNEPPFELYINKSDYYIRYVFAPCVSLQYHFAILSK